MAAQQSKQKTDFAFPTPSPRRIQQPNDGARKHDCQINGGGLEGMEKIALQQRLGFATQRDAGTQLGMWCVPTMAKREEDEGRETGRTKERKKDALSPRGPLPPHRPFQPVHPFWVASL